MMILRLKMFVIAFLLLLLTVQVSDEDADEEYRMEKFLEKVERILAAYNRIANPDDSSPKNYSVGSRPVVLSSDLDSVEDFDEKYIMQKNRTALKKEWNRRKSKPDDSSPKNYSSTYRPASLPVVLPGSVMVNDEDFDWKCLTNSSEELNRPILYVMMPRCIWCSSFS